MNISISCIVFFCLFSVCLFVFKSLKYFLSCFLPLKGGFSNGHFLLTSDVFTITNEGVVHLLSNSSLDRETRDNYVLEVQLIFIILFLWAQFDLQKN